MWKKNIPSFDSIHDLVLRKPTSTIPSSAASIKPQDYDIILSDLTNENKVLREELFQLYNQLAWFENQQQLRDENHVQHHQHHHPVANQQGNPPSTADISPIVDVDLSPVTQPSIFEAQESFEAYTSLLSSSHPKMILTRDVGTMIDPNIFLIDSLDQQDNEEQSQTLFKNDDPPRETSLPKDGNAEPSNRMTYESRYYQQKLLNQLLDKRINYLDEKVQQMEDKLQHCNRMRLENLSLRLRAKEYHQYKQSQTTQIQKYEKSLYQMKYENQRNQELILHQSQRIQELLNSLTQQEEELKESKERIEVIIKENHQLSEDVRLLRDYHAEDERKIDRSSLAMKHYEQKCESQVKEILRLQMQLELLQTKIAFTPILLHSPFPLHPDTDMDEGGEEEDEEDGTAAEERKKIAFKASHETLRQESQLTNPNERFSSQSKPSEDIPHLLRGCWCGPMND